MSKLHWLFPQDVLKLHCSKHNQNILPNGYKAPLQIRSKLRIDKMDRISIPDRFYHCQDALSDAYNGFQQNNWTSAIHFNFILQGFVGNVGEAQGTHPLHGDPEIVMEVITNADKNETLGAPASRLHYIYKRTSRTWFQTPQQRFEDLKSYGMRHVFLRVKDCQHGIEHSFNLWFSPRCYKAFMECSPCQSGKCDEHMIESMM